MQLEQAKPSIKSRPSYPPVKVNEAVQQHLFITESDAFQALDDLYQSCSGEKSCCLVGLPDAKKFNKYPKGCRFIEAPMVESSFSKIFSELPVSSSIYVAANRESFLWDIHNLAVKAGLAEEQIKLHKPLSNERRLFCTHCYHTVEGVTYSPFECPNCHRLLLVRDHFSRIHSAYVGVEINAEDRNEFPVKEELS